MRFLMQNTRLNRLVDSLLDRFSGWLQNPWRRTSLLIISLLFGNFLATAISTTTGQGAYWDVLVAALITSFTEIVSWFVYGLSRRDRPELERRSRSLTIECLNTLKIGLIYGLFVDSLKLGS
jgi:Protein of unknown function (DUF565)